MLDANEGLVTRIGVVGYRDFTDHKLYEVLPFTTVVADARNFIAKLQAIGGGDAPEDLVGGFKLKSDLSLLEKNTKNLTLMFSKDDDVIPEKYDQTKKGGRGGGRERDS